MLLYLLLCRLLLYRQAKGMTSSSVDSPLPSPLPFTAAAMHHTGINKHTTGSIQQPAGLSTQTENTETASTLTFLNASRVISSVDQLWDAFAAFGLQCACGDHGDSPAFFRGVFLWFQQSCLKNDVAASVQQSKRAVSSSLRGRWLIKEATIWRQRFKR